MGARSRSPREGCGGLRELEIDTRAGRLRVFVNECTYPPSDDSELAVEALAVLREEGRSYSSIIDLGSGSGVLALAAYKIFRPRIIAAVEAHRCPAVSSRLSLPSHLLVAICPSASCLKSVFDLAIVNPPYLPERPPRGDECGEVLARSWAGEGVMEGMLGAAAGLAREVLAVYSSLSPIGVPEFFRRLGFSFRVLASRRFFMESVEVGHAWRG
ncbi:MAG: class I SAM-dependent methyltransferase [Aeropyrum sp.]|nr:class I SAM-dependent methyltransferase [Aeropyrum sp.]MCE4615759.1 class I SAM-dependent methyltransferase [Aeropyrum sp.]